METDNRLYTEQKKTISDLIYKLGRYHKCAILRPPGFGKTYILTELAHMYDNVLYVYPSAVIKDTVIRRYQELDDGYDVDPETMETKRNMEEITGCTLLTYAKMARMEKQELTDMGFDLVIFDEMHRMGGPLTRLAVERMFADNPDTFFAGATATPNRMDGFDVVSIFFSDITTYLYTMHDAVCDSILKKPNYCYCTYDVDADLKEQCLTAGEDPDDPKVKTVLDIRRVEIANLFGVPKIIRYVCGLYATDTDYMKFIVFFSSIAHMDEKLPEVQAWFQEAYPDHNVNTLRISSLNAQETKNTDYLPGLIRRPATVDLIGCVNMLNLGYHVNDQTGIFMYRGTQSSTIFIQQMGRAMSAGMNNSGIIFDLVDNLHRKALYDINLSYGVSANMPRPTAYVMTDSGDVVLPDREGNPMTTQYHRQSDGTIVDLHGNRATLNHSEKDNKIYDVGDSKKKNTTLLTPECIHVVWNMASYREIIAKAVAEPMSQRCRSALMLHFRTWCRNHNLPYPISNEKIKQLRNMDKTDFYDTFLKLLHSNKLDYPLHDTEQLLQIGQNGETDIPLSICAEAKNVSVQQILNLLGIT